MISIITNTRQTHKQELLSLFEESEKVIIAVGFLKPSGLANIRNCLEDFCKDLSKTATFYIGTGLGETSPKTLVELLDILSQNPSNELILCTPNAGIFHPKIYVFVKKDSVKIIIGSANLTEAGWMINDEVSMRMDTTIESSEYLRLNSYLQNLYDLYHTDDILGLINEYKNQLDAYRKDSRPAFHFKRRKIDMGKIDMPRLEAYYIAYLNPDHFIDVEMREEKYAQAKSNLLEISSKAQLSTQQFHDLFGPLVGHQGYAKLWHSGSIHRKTHKTLDYIPGFRKIVRVARKIIDLPVSAVFDQVKNLKNQMKIDDEIHGVGENILTEILMTMNPTKFANLNVNPLAVLSSLGKDFPSVSSFKGETYREYVDVLTDIKECLNMKSFLEIDSFFNYVYWNIREQ